MDSLIFPNGSLESSMNLSYPTGISLNLSPYGTALYVICYIPVLLAIIIGNILVILAFVYNRQLRKVQYYLLVSLAVTDLLTGVFALPTLVFARLVVSPVVCFASTRLNFFLPSLTFCGSSVYHLLFIAIDRCLSLIFPLKYPQLVTSRRVTILIGIIWIYNINIASLPVYLPSPETDQWVCNANGSNEKAVDNLFLAISFFIPFYLFCMITLYAVMLRVAFSHIKKRRKLTNQDNTVKEAQARMRGILTMAIVVGAFGICWIPTSLKFYVESFVVTTKRQLLVMQTLAEYLSFVSSMVNPVIYGYFNRQFKLGFKMVLGKWGCLQKEELIARIPGKTNSDQQSSTTTSGIE